MNILVIGSAIEGLNKAMGWLYATTYIVNRLVFVEECTAKMAYVYDKVGSQPHPINLFNLAVVPDGEENSPVQYMTGKAKDINDLICESFPDGSVDFLFFCVKNSKAKIMLNGLKDKTSVRKYYLNDQDQD